MTWLDSPLLPAITAFVLALPGCDNDPCDDAPGSVCTWAGVKGQRGYNGDGLDRQESWLAFPSDLTFDPQGAPWIVDWNNHRIRRVEADGTLTTTIGNDQEGDGSPGETDRLPVGNPSGADAQDVSLNHPTDIEFAPDGTVVLAAWHNNKIRVMDPDSGVLTVLAGDSYGYSGEGTPAWQAVFNQPKAIVVDDDGGIILTDQRNQRVRRIEPDGERLIRTIAGVGTLGYTGDGGPALAAEFAFDGGVTPTPSGALALRGNELFVADSENHRIRRIDLESGEITCIAGDGEAVAFGDGGAALDASLGYPRDIEFGPDGRLYVADGSANSVRAIDLGSGMIDRVAGTGEACEGYFNCFEEAEGGSALDLRFSDPYGIAFDAEGRLYVADTNNSRIVRIVP